MDCPVRPWQCPTGPCRTPGLAKRALERLGGRTQQNEWSKATARSNSACASAVQETVKWTVPSVSEPVVFSCAVPVEAEATGSASKPTAIAIVLAKSISMTSWVRWDELLAPMVRGARQRTVSSGEKGRYAGAINSCGTGRRGCRRDCRSSSSAGSEPRSAPARSAFEEGAGSPCLSRALATRSPLAPEAGRTSLGQHDRGAGSQQPAAGGVPHPAGSPCSRARADRAGCRHGDGRPLLPRHRRARLRPPGRRGHRRRARGGGDALWRPSSRWNKRRRAGLRDLAHGRTGTASRDRVDRATAHPQPPARVGRTGGGDGGRVTTSRPRSAARARAPGPDAPLCEPRASLGCLRQFRVCADILRRELGVEPEMETRAIHREILGRPALRAGTTRGAPLGETRPSSDSDRLALGGGLAHDRTRPRALDSESLVQGVGARLVAVLGEAGIGESNCFKRSRRRLSRQGWPCSAGEVTDGALFPSECGWERSAARASTPSVRRSGIWPRVAGRAGSAHAGACRARPPRRRRGGELPRLFEAVARLLLSLARARWVLVALEDLHWADETTVRLLAFLARRVDGAAVYFVVTLRAEEVGPGSVLRGALDELRGGGQLIEIGLAPLSEPATAQLVRLLAPRKRGTAIADITRAVWRLSGGHPLAVVEAVKTMAADAATGAAGAGEIPERVRQPSSSSWMGSTSGREASCPLLP